MFHSRRRVSSLACALIAMCALSLWGLAPEAAGASPPSTLGGDGGLVSFRAQSLTFLSSDQGWVLGAANCGNARCTTVAGTLNSGHTWTRLGTVPAPLAPPGEPGVTTVRFADAAHGFAFGPSLYVSNDGGRRWRASALPGGATQVLDLAASGGAVYMVTSVCPLGQGQCSARSQLWRSAGGTLRWESVPVQLPATLGAHLSTWHRVAYVVGVNDVGQPDTFAATTDGRRWSARPSPCAHDGDTNLVAADAFGPRQVAVLCVGDPGFGKAVKTVFRSTDAGMHFASAGTAPLAGIAAWLGVSPAGTLLMPATGQQSFLYLNASGSTWATHYVDPNGYPWADPTFTTARTAYVVHGPASTPGFPGDVLVSRDTGTHWTPLTIGS